LILFGFNPISLWGLTKLFRLKRNVPWKGTFYSSLRITNWLQALGFKVEDPKTFCFRPPVGNKMMERLAFLDSMGPLCWPYWGGSYILVAKKETALVKPLRAPKYRKIPITSGYPEPSGYK
jgi:hypothetical protein